MADRTSSGSNEVHDWLRQLVGEWSWETDGKHRGTERVRSIGGTWIVAEGHGETPDGIPSETLMTLGYSPGKSAYVGTFISSTMANMWIYEGWLDPAQNALVLDTEGPGFVDPSHRARYKDTIRIIDRDNRILTSEYQGEGGNWYQLMRVHYRRK